VRKKKKKKKEKEMAKEKEKKKDSPFYRLAALTSNAFHFLTSKIHSFLLFPRFPLRSSNTRVQWYSYPPPPV